MTLIFGEGETQSFYLTSRLEFYLMLFFRYSLSVSPFFWMLMKTNQTIITFRESRENINFVTVGNAMKEINYDKLSGMWMKTKRNIFCSNINWVLMRCFQFTSLLSKKKLSFLFQHNKFIRVGSGLRNSHFVGQIYLIVLLKFL